jgi:hypothetical protein
MRMLDRIGSDLNRCGVQIKRLIPVYINQIKQIHAFYCGRYMFG